MITRKVVDGGSHVKVTFALPCEAADRVAVVGDFNEWDATVTPMRKRGDTRSASVTLEPGSRYGFRYLDGSGRWFNDDQADGFEQNEFGDSNCVIDLTGYASI